jgi:phosphotransferase system enzyme I (PtsI)
MAEGQPKPRATERRIQGLGVSPGVGIGTAHVRESGFMNVPEYAIAKRDVELELARFRRAILRAQRQIGRLRARASAREGLAAEEISVLFDGYLNMLKDSRLVRGVQRRIGELRVNAEAAIQAETADIANAFAAMKDAYIAARLDDIRSIANRLMLNLTERPVKPFSSLPRGSVVIADQLTPADAAQLNPQRVAGCAASLGAPESHTAIMARALGIPAVLGAPGLIEGARSGDRVIVDGGSGWVIVNPSAETLADYERRRDEHLKETHRLARLRNLPAVTRDGVELVLQANVELPIEMAMVQQVGAQGIGLLRSEFMFMNRADIPGEDEQYAALKGIVEGVNGATVTVRTLDVGEEKPAPALLGSLKAGAASALGLRGIRLSLANTELLETQFRAILRAAQHGNVRILLPMVSAVSEVKRARDVLLQAEAKLKRRHVPIGDALPPLGVMIEVPGAALSADALAQASDFFAIGSNDLTMYTLAIDRGNEHVAHLFDPLHPAVLRLVQFAAEAALRARIPVSICGEVAGDPRYTALLLGLGFRELSMTALSIPRVKRRIRDIDLVAADRRARLIMDQVDSGRIAALLDDFNALA